MITYIIGLLITITLLLIWFYSPFRITIGQLFIDKEMYTFDQFENFVLCKNVWLGKLLSCYICFSFWTSLIVGAVIVFLCQMPLWYPLLTGFTYPGLCYLYKKYID